MRSIADCPKKTSRLLQYMIRKPSKSHLATKHSGVDTGYLSRCLHYRGRTKFDIVITGCHETAPKICKICMDHTVLEGLVKSDAVSGCLEWWLSSELIVSVSAVTDDAGQLEVISPWHGGGG